VYSCPYISLARMFMIARTTVIAIYEDISEAYIENMKRRNGHCVPVLIMFQR